MEALFPSEGKEKRFKNPNAPNSLLRPVLVCSAYRPDIKGEHLGNGAKNWENVK